VYFYSHFHKGFCGLNTLFKIPVIFKGLFNLLSMSSSPCQYPQVPDMPTEEYVATGITVIL